MLKRLLRKIRDNAFFTKIFSWLKRLFILLFLVHLGYAVALIFLPVPTTMTIISRWLGGATIQRQWVSYDQISINAKKAVIAAEDQAFEDHLGIDWESVEKAIEHNKKSRKTHGGSTISQQVAKNVFLWQGRTWLRKGLEVYCTFLIEMLWSKEHILEVYLNVAEMGDGIFGIEAAARAHFGKTAAQLTATESAAIAACLPNPIKYNAANPPARVQKRQQWILRQMRYLDAKSDLY